MNPSFVVVAVITLALGIGANTTIFSVVNAVLLRSLPYQNPEQLVTLWERNPKLGYEQNAPAAGNYLDWREQNTTFRQLAIYAPSRRFNLAIDDQAERINGAAVSASLFDTLGISAAEGRVFSVADEQSGNEQVALISHNFRKVHFPQRSPIGETLNIDSKPYTIIGVMPVGFQFPGGTGTVLRTFTAAPAEIWTPLVLDAETVRQRSSHSLQVIGRLNKDVTLVQANTEMDSIQQRIERQYPNFFVGSHVKLVPLTEQIAGSTRRPILILWAAVIFVLLICCVNVANLLLSRATSRQREIAIRSALGAGRGRIVRELLAESLLLSMVGGIAGVVLALWSVRALVAILPPTFPLRENIAIDGPVLLFTIVVTLFTGLLFGIVPAWQSTKLELSKTLKASVRNSATSEGRRLRNLLVVSEMALALTLLIAAALMIQSFFKLQRVDPGFRADRLLTMEMSLPANSYPRAQRPAFFESLIERTAALPAVQSVALAKHLPLTGENMNFAFYIEGRPFPQGQSPGADVRFVSPSYFKTLNVPIRRGRSFFESDGPQTPHTLLINESMAQRYFPNQDPLGQRLELGINGFAGEIVGVVGDVKHEGLDAHANDEVYVNYSQAPFWTDMTLIVQTSGDPMDVVSSIRNELLAVDRKVPIGRVRTMQSILTDSAAQPRFRSLLLGLFSATALILAAVGIYGVMSYAVTQRTNEIGIRMALGAQHSDVKKLVILNGMSLVVVGIVVGLASSFAITRLLSGLLFGVGATDPTTFAAVAFGLGTIALIACYIPARRATKVDPLIALRSE